MRTRLYICISVLLAIVSGCQQPYEMKLDFALNRDELRFTKAESQAYFLVYSQGAWTAEFETPVAWATLSRTSGHGNQQVAVVCEKNTSVSRGARIIVTNHDGKVKTVYLSQESSLSDVYYTMSESNLQLLAKGASVNLSAETNIPEEVFADVTYQVESTAGTDWISDIVATPEGFSCVVADYIGEEGREAVVGVYFPAAEWDETRCKSFLTIKQSAVKPQITLATDHELNPDGGIVTSVPLEFNWAAEFYAYDLSYITFSDDTWVSAVYDAESQSVKVTPQRNKTGQPRQTVMTCHIKDLDGTVINTATTTLTQGVFEGIDPVDAVALYEGEKYANCYLVQDKVARTYWFEPKRVDSTLPSDDIVSAEILWQNLTNPVRTVQYENGRIYFRTISGNVGNAVIAARDSEGVICWSWHIWVAGETVGTNTFNSTETGVGPYVFMDRNIGATSKSGPSAAGLHYQYGRKDPFPGADPTKYASGENQNSITVAPDAIEPHSAQNGVTQEWAIQNPHKYIWGTANSGAEDWLSIQGTDLWGDGKQIIKTNQDPCPYGWAVPTKSAYRNSDWWNNMLSSGSGEMTVGEGATCKDSNNETAYYLFSGRWRRSASDYDLAHVGTHCYLWTSTESTGLNSNYKGTWHIRVRNNKGALSRGEETNQPRRWGANVRCVKIND